MNEPSLQRAPERPAYNAFISAMYASRAVWLNPSAAIKATISRMPTEPDTSTSPGSVRKEVAAWLAEQLHDVAQLAETEEDLRVAAEDKLRQALGRIGITSTASYERTYADHAGRSDAVYGRVVIEYEAVGALSTKGGVSHAAEQLERYLRAEADQATQFDALKRVVGVGLDGHQIFFLRFRGAPTENEPELYVAPGQGILPLENDPALAGNLTPVLDGPYRVSAESIQTFLLYLQAANRSRLTAEGLAKQFGPSGPCAKSVIKTLIKLLEEHANDVTVQTFFKEWDRLFGIVYGVDLDKINHHLPVLREAYDLPEHSTFKRMLFAVHTYYALLMKLLASELVSKQRESLIDSYLDDLPSASDDKLLRAVERIESGELFAQFSVQNFLEADFFGWYLTAWNAEVADAVRSVVRLLVTFEPATGFLDPRPTQDLLKRLYQYLVPRQIRHDLGEFYTPNWLADFTIDESGYRADIDARVLDPACGSGTFLISVINRLRDKHSEDSADQTTLAKAILRNVVGFELNPLAVIAARTNYLLALGPLTRLVAPLEIPIYLCDSILAPTMTDLGLLGETYELPTSAAVFRVPRAVVAEGNLANLTGLLDRCLQSSYTKGEFRQLAARELPELDELAFDEIVRLYESLLDLKVGGRDGIWVRIIRNAFAPLTSGLFDYVLGNPPWVNWQSLAPDYRSATMRFWTDYGLFSLTGHAARLGGGKKDLAALMTYRAVDAYVRSGGRLGFVVTNSLFKSKGAGDGFRRFQIGSGAYLKVITVHDLTAFQPFELATTQASVIIISKGAKTVYPVKYMKWTKKGGGPRVKFTSSLGVFRAAAKAEEFAAAPVELGLPRSPWLTAPAAVDQALRPVLGRSEYRAFAGVCTWANGIYWLEIIEKAPQGLLRVRNMAEEAKEHNVEQKTALIEPRHVYPLVRSRDISRWSAKTSAYILVPQDPQARRGIPESMLRVEAPRTYGYLKAFEAQLSVRSGMIKYFDAEKGDPFYSVYNVSQGTFASFKVMWRQMVPQVRAAVVRPIEDPYLGKISPVTQHVVSEIAAESEIEAHYVCAMLNSSIVTCISGSYSTGKSFGTPSMLDYVRMPRFSAETATHVALAELSLEAHALAAEGKATEETEDKIDLLAVEVFGISLPDLPPLRAEARRIGRVHAQLPLPLEE